MANRILNSRSIEKKSYAIFDPDFFISVANCTTYSTIFYCTFIHCTGQLLFAYYCVGLGCCSEELLSQQETFLLRTIKKETSVAISDDIYMTSLQNFLKYSLNVEEVFHEVHATFRWKLLLDVIAITVAVLNKVAWLSVFLLNPGDVAVFSVWSKLSLVRHCIYTIVYLFCGWTVLVLPVWLNRLVRIKLDMAKSTRIYYLTNQSTMISVLTIAMQIKKSMNFINLTYVGYRFSFGLASLHTLTKNVSVSQNKKTADVVDRTMGLRRCAIQGVSVAI